MLNPTHLHFVYRYFDDEDVLLYVGESADPSRRAQDHANAQQWWPEVARVEVATFLNASAAKAEEARAIRDERPVYNLAGAPRPFRRGDRAADRDRSRQAWRGANRPGQPVPASCRRHRLEARRQAALVTDPSDRPRGERELYRWDVALGIVGYWAWLIGVRLPARILWRYTLPSAVEHGGATLRRVRHALERRDSISV